MPMPPTTSETRDAREQVRHGLVGLRAQRDHVVQRLNREVVRRRPARCHASCAAGVDRPPARPPIVGRARRDVDAVQVLLARKLLHHGGVGREASGRPWFMPPAAAPLRAITPSTLEDMIAHADLRVGRIDAFAEQQVRHVGAEHDDLAGDAHVFGVKKLPYFSGQDRIAGRSTFVPSTLRVPVHAAVDELRARRRRSRRRTATSGNSRSASASSGTSRVLVPPPPRTPRRRRGCPAKIVIRLVPAGRICSSIGLRAGAQRHHRDDRGHADDHAEHGQRRPQLVAAERLEGDPKRHQHRHVRSSVLSKY